MTIPYNPQKASYCPTGEDQPIVAFELNPGLTTSKHDANGYLVPVQDSTEPKNDRQFVNDADGHILLKIQKQDGNDRSLRQLLVNG